MGEKALGDILVIYHTEPEPVRWAQLLGLPEHRVPCDHISFTIHFECSGQVGWVTFIGHRVSPAHEKCARFGAVALARTITAEAMQ